MIREFLVNYKWQIGLFLMVLLVGAWGIFLLKGGGRFPNGIFSVQEGSNVSLPTIINGELVLPKTDNKLSKIETANKLGVVSANLVGVFGEQQKFVGIRIVGEMANLGQELVTAFNPVVRFLDKDGKNLGQKIGRNSAGYDFFGVAAGEKTLYDVTVDNPPTSDRVELILNVVSASSSASFDELKIASRSVEIKTASGSAGEKVDYFIVSGAVVNTLSGPVSDIAVLAWAKDKENKVFSVGRTDFKNDLLMAGDKVDFKIILLPFKPDEKYDSYEVAAWGKRYRLNL